MRRTVAGSCCTTRLSSSAEMYASSICRAHNGKKPSSTYASEMLMLTKITSS